MQLSIDKMPIVTPTLAYHTIPLSIYITYSFLCGIGHGVASSKHGRIRAGATVGRKETTGSSPVPSDSGHVIRKWCHGATVPRVPFPRARRNLLLSFFSFPSISLAFRRRRNSPCRLGRRVLRATDTQTREEKASGKRGTPW